MRMFRWAGVALIAMATLSIAEAQEMLSNVQIVGTIERTGKAPAFKVGDTIKVIEDNGGAIAATGSVLDSNGTFYVEMTKSAKYNGTPVHLEIVVQGEQLPLKEGKNAAKLVYKGGFPFPKRETKTLSYGDGVPTGKPAVATPTAAVGGPAAPANPAAASICPATLPKCDANGDGSFDQKDIDLVKAQLTAKPADLRADLNGDGVVNSADMVAGIRELNSKR